MVQVDLTPRAIKFIKSLPPKHKRQVKDYILSFQENPEPHDARPLIGHPPYLRADVGEYRIVYRYDVKKKVITIVLVGKRNDNAVYRIVKRIIK